MSKKEKHTVWESLGEYISKEWAPFLRFMIKPLILISLIYFVLSIVFTGTEFYKSCNLLFSFISLILGLLIKQEWDRYRGHTDYKTKALPAICVLDGLESDIKKRIEDYSSRRPTSHEIRQFLQEVCTRINDSRAAWKTFEPENPYFTKFTDIQGTAKANENKSEQKIDAMN